jgi:hypothetical protein
VTDPARPRSTARDLIGTLAVLLLIIGAFVWITRACTFSPGGPTVDRGSAPTIDASRALRVAASSAGFPIRIPLVPADWHANSSSTSAAPGTVNVIVRVGWLTPAGRYLQLSQSAAAPPDVYRTETDRPDFVATGTVDIAGLSWTTYPGRRDEQTWITQLNNVTILITGSAPEPDFRTLATTLQSTTPTSR